MGSGATTIQLLRESIDQRPEDWRQLLASERFMTTFLPKAEGSAESALKAFADENKEGSLKTRPKVRFSPFRKTAQVRN